MTERERQRLWRAAERNRTAYLLLIALKVGTSAKAIAEAADMDLAEAKAFVDLARSAGIFRRGKIVHGGWDDPDPELAACGFWCDVCCVDGLMERTEAER